VGRFIVWSLLLLPQGRRFKRRYVGCEGEKIVRVEKCEGKWGWNFQPTIPKCVEFYVAVCSVTLSNHDSHTIQYDHLALSPARNSIARLQSLATRVVVLARRATRSRQKLRHSNVGVVSHTPPTHSSVLASTRPTPIHGRVPETQIIIQ
jgi:hypothetical protein